MKIIITGSLGHISKPLSEELAQAGHEVTIISSDENKRKDIEAIGAKAAIGSLENADFLIPVFTGADAVYCMVPPAYYYNPALDPMEFYRTIGSNYVKAIQRSSVKRVVNLSSFGADLDKGTGLILGSHEVEVMLDGLTDVSVTHIRPTSFYYNFFGFIKMIKDAEMIAANYGGEDKIPMVSPKDIAAAIAEEMVIPAGNKVRYVASDEHTCNETAQILGAAIGKPDLKWITVSNEQMQSGLEAAGMTSKLAAGLVELYESLHNGTLAKDYYLHKPLLGKVKLEDFAKEFAAVFNQ